MKEEKRLNYDDPAAATYRENIKGWVGADGRYWGEDEHMARWSACTHIRCECGNYEKKGYTMCKDCRDKNELERYEKKPFKEYTPDMVVCDDATDEYFFDEDTLAEYIHENPDARLVICDGQFPSYLDDSYWEDIIPEDMTLRDSSEELADAVERLNEVVKSLHDNGKPLSWFPGKFRTEYKKK